MEERRRVVVSVPSAKTRNSTSVALGMSGSKAKVDMSTLNSSPATPSYIAGAAVRDSSNTVNIRSTAFPLKSPVNIHSTTTSYGSSTAQSRSRSPERLPQNNTTFNSTPPVASTSQYTPTARLVSANGTRGAKVIGGSGAKVVGSVVTTGGGSATRSHTFPTTTHPPSTNSTPSRVYPEQPFNTFSNSPGPSGVNNGAGRARTTTAGGGMMSLLSSPAIRSPPTSVFPSNQSTQSSVSVSRSTTGPTSPPLPSSPSFAPPLVKSNSLNRAATPSSRPPLNRPITSPVIKSTPSPFTTTTPRLPPQPVASNTGSHGRSRSVASIFSTAGSTRSRSTTESNSHYDGGSGSVSRLSNNDRFRRDSTFGEVDDGNTSSGVEGVLSEVGGESTGREIEAEIERERERIIVESESRRVAEEREEKDARVRRKVLDLEITNKSLLSINSSLELTKVKQTSEIRDLRRRLRESRTHLPISTLSMSISDREFPEEGRRPPDDYSDDEDLEEEDREMTWEEILEEDPTFAGVTRTLMTLIKKGKVAILEKDVEVPPEGTGFGRVLHSSELVEVEDGVKGVESGLGAVQEDEGEEVGGSADQSFDLDDQLGNVTFLADTLANAASHQSSFLAPADPSSFYPSPLLSSSTNSSGSSASDSSLPSVRSSSPQTTPYAIESSPRLAGLGTSYRKPAEVDSFRREANMLGL